ncbi:hypothetical protein J2741_002029 [Methanolinea mesophila]|nr:hypothetical protein [Methanolinea mesophila]
MAFIYRIAPVTRLISTIADTARLFLRIVITGIREVTGEKWPDSRYKAA